MALPKLETPTYELELPSTGEKIKYRPFLVKEQKVLMMAQESKKEDEIINTISSIIDSCTFNKLSGDSLPMFDVEYIFLKIRSKSVGETSTVQILCPDDEETRVPTTINLEEVDVQMTKDHSNEIIISDDIKMIMKYPRLGDMKKINTGESQVKQVFSILKLCVKEIHHGETIYNSVDISDKDIEEFVDNFTTSQFEGVTNFFDSMPKLRHTVMVTNPKTNVQSEVTLEGMQSFLA